MSDTVFVTMYHPALGNVQVDAPLIAVPTYQSHGWLLLDPSATPPPIATPYLTQAAGDSRYVRDWAGAETVTAGAIRMAPDGHVIVRTADGTTRSSYDTTETAAWTPVGGQTAAQLAADPALKAAFGSLDGDNVFTGVQQITGKLAVNTTPDAKQPIALAATVDGPTVRASGSTHDKVGLAEAVLVTGDFTGDTGSNAGFLWGKNVFTNTGSTAGDGKGISTIVGALLEAAVGTPAGVTFDVVRGLEAHVSFFGAAAGATITQMETLRVSAPRRKDGATAGTATNVYGLFVEEVDGAAVGASGSTFSLFVAGGLSRIQGSRLDVPAAVNTDAGVMKLTAYYADANGASLELDGNATGGNSGNATVAISKSGSVFQVKNASARVFSVGQNGNMNITNSAAAPTASPTSGGYLYSEAGALKWRGSGGTITTIAAA